MTSLKKHSVLHCLFALTLIVGTACGDDDASNGNTGGSGGTAGKSEGGTGGKGGSGGKGGTGGKGGSASDEDAGVATIKAADLRVTIDLLLGEHMSLAAKTTGAALAKHDEESAAYQELLNKNGTDLGDLVGKALGDTAKTAFNDSWSAHNGYFVDYTKAVATKNSDDKTKAENNLADYVKQFSALLVVATGLDKAAVTEMVNAHVMQTAAVVDAQAAALASNDPGDWTKVYDAYREAFAHLYTVGDALAAGLKDKAPDVITGDVKSNAIDLRIELNKKLQEHLYLATFATDAILNDRLKEADAANAALGKNGTEIGSDIKLIYDAAAETKFNDLWSAHNGYFVDYTNGVKENSDTKKNDAVDNLKTKYVPMFADFLHGATDLPTDDLKTLIQDHVNDTAAVVDAQHGGKDKATDAAKADRTAAQHMQMLADPLAAAIAKKKGL